mmetsp:Transcript_30384/g.73314  ORF Transcript_30384/g.73314 Transcript_30384/m.73314 type:complete len:117 (-) Transcript_30384:36-386(-)
MLRSHQYQQQHHAHIRLGLSNKNQLILASSMGPNHQRLFWGTCRPNGATIMKRRIKHVGRDDRRKSWDSSAWFWICSLDATMILSMVMIYNMRSLFVELRQFIELFPQLETGAGRR